MFGFKKKDYIAEFIDDNFGDHIVIARLKKMDKHSICALEGSRKELCSLLIDFAHSTPDMKELMYVFSKGYIRAYEEEQAEKKAEKKKNGKGKN